MRWKPALHEHASADVEAPVDVTLFAGQELHASSRPARMSRYWLNSQGAQKADRAPLDRSP